MKLLTSMKVQAKLSQLLIGGSSPPPTQLRIVSRDPMLEGSAWAEGGLSAQKVLVHTDFDSSARNFMIYQRPTTGALQDVCPACIIVGNLAHNTLVGKCCSRPVIHLQQLPSILQEKCSVHTARSLPCTERNRTLQPCCVQWYWRPSSGFLS